MQAHDTAHDEHGGLVRGAVVDYHGTRTGEHGRYVIVARHEQRGRYTITGQDCPWLRLRNVRAASLTPTGEHEILCTSCDHAVDWHRLGAPEQCSVYPCWCTTHIGPPSQTQARPTTAANATTGSGRQP